MCEEKNTIPVKQVAGLLETIQHLYIESELYSIVIIGEIIGKSYDEIITILKGFEFLNDCSQVNPERFILEIRREKCTITCVFINFICTDAYVFNDRYDT